MFKSEISVSKIIFNEWEKYFNNGAEFKHPTQR